MRHPITNGHFTGPDHFTCINLFLIMKNAVLNLTAFLLLASASVACKKEPTFRDQLVGHWKSVKVTVADEDVTDTYLYDLNLEGSLEFDLDVSITFASSQNPVTIVQSYNGDWDEDETKQDLMLHYTNGDQKTWDVVSISETGITAETTSSDNKRHKVQFVRQ